jgi:hypothetical protein
VTWPQVTAGTVLRLLVASAVVGMAMAYFDFTPRDVVRYVTGFATEIVDNAAAWVGTAISYVLLGAVIVDPDLAHQPVAEDLPALSPPPRSAAASSRNSCARAVPAARTAGTDLKSS